MNWFEQIAASVASVNCTVFHAGFLRRTANFTDDLRLALERRGLASAVVDCGQVTRDGWDGHFPEPGPASGGRVTLVWCPEALLQNDRVSELLRQVRPRVQEELISGGRVLIVSAVPQMLFPAPDGSSIIADAVKIHPRPFTLAQIRAIAPELTAADAADGVTHSRGCAALAEESVAISRSGGSNNRKRQRAAAFLGEALHRSLTELGPELLALLEHLVLECGNAEISEDDLSDAHMSTLQDAGLAVVDDRAGCVEIFPSTWASLGREALARALREIIKPTESWRHISNALFTIERKVRLALVQHLADRQGAAWRATSLGDLGGKALAMARNDGYGWVQRVEDLHQPFDWLYIDQLFDVAASVSAGEPVGGIPPHEWRRLATQLVPIRNRVSHMRLPQPGDLDTVRKCLRQLSVRFDASDVIRTAAPTLLVSGEKRSTESVS